MWADGSKDKPKSYERTGLTEDPTLSELAQIASNYTSEDSVSAER